MHYKLDKLNESFMQRLTLVHDEAISVKSENLGDRQARSAGFADTKGTGLESNIIQTRLVNACILPED